MSRRRYQFEVGDRDSVSLFANLKGEKGWGVVQDSVGAVIGGRQGRAGNVAANIDL